MNNLLNSTDKFVQLSLLSEHKVELFTILISIIMLLHLHHDEICIASCWITDSGLRILNRIDILCNTLKKTTCRSLPCLDVPFRANCQVWTINNLLNVFEQKHLLRLCCITYCGFLNDCKLPYSPAIVTLQDEIEFLEA